MIFDLHASLTPFLQLHISGFSISSFWNWNKGCLVYSIKLSPESTWPNRFVNPFHSLFFSYVHVVIVSYLSERLPNLRKQQAISNFRFTIPGPVIGLRWYTSRERIERSSLSLLCVYYIRTPCYYDDDVLTQHENYCCKKNVIHTAKWLVIKEITGNHCFKWTVHYTSHLVSVNLFDSAESGDSNSCFAFSINWLQFMNHVLQTFYYMVRWTGIVYLREIWEQIRSIKSTLSGASQWSTLKPIFTVGLFES